MGIIKKPIAVKLVIGALFGEQAYFDQVKIILEERFGPIETLLPPFPFLFTNYYKEEIGESPYRGFFSFEKLLSREEIVDIKLWTNALELQIAAENALSTKRPINLDPGYMTLGQFFLAKTNDNEFIFVMEFLSSPPFIFKMDTFIHLIGLIATTKAPNTYSI